jgi:hypothetical protein
VLFAALSPARSASTMPTMTARIAISPADETAKETFEIRLRASDSSAARSSALRAARKRERRAAGEKRESALLRALGDGGRGRLDLGQVAREAGERGCPERQRALRPPARSAIRALAATSGRTW